MRKIKLELKCRVPSWNFCNHDGPTPDQRFSKEICRFCVPTKKGHYCTLHDEWLSADKHFIHKSQACIKATAGYAISVDERAPQVDPKLIIRETIKTYNKTLSDLIKQGYPHSLAETIAVKYLTGDN